MQIVWCLGGLGNQMFQYAFYRTLEFSGKEVCLDISEFTGYDLHNGFELKRIFNLNPRFIDTKTAMRVKSNFFLKALRKLRVYSYLIEQTDFGYADYYLGYRLPHFFKGYWQSEKYFSKIQDQIRKDFSFKELDQVNQEYANKINQSQSVSIHVRRGDYAKHPLHGGICTKEYYLQAVKFILDTVDNPQFFVFSDDINWCKENLAIKDASFINGNNGENSYKDMQLMSLCKHNIIANSSFSWWGAWLNPNPTKMIIAPKKWFNDPKINIKDLLPEQWIRL